MLNLPPLIRRAFYLPVSILVHLLSLRLRRNTLVITIIVGLAVGVVLSLVFTMGLPGQSQDKFLNSLGGQSGIYFLGNIYNVDFSSRIVTVSWLIGACGNYSSFTMYGSNNCSAPNIPVAVYINGASQPNFEYDPTLQPQIIQGSETLVPYQGLDEYQTKHPIDINIHKFIVNSTKAAIVSASFGQTFFYPFDTFYTGMNIIAMNPNVSNSSAVPIIAVLFSGYGSSLAPDSDVVATTRIVNGAAVSSRYAFLTLRRKTFTIVFVIFIFSLNWFLTAAVAGVTAFAYSSNSGHITDGIMALPVTVILTLPTLRGLSVESPPVGIMLDIGFFFQMMVVSICSVALLVKFTLKSRKKAEKGEEPLPLLSA